MSQGALQDDYYPDLIIGICRVLGLDCTSSALSHFLRGNVMKRLPAYDVLRLDEEGGVIVEFYTVCFGASRCTGTAVE